MGVVDEGEISIFMSVVDGEGWIVVNSNPLESKKKKTGEAEIRNGFLLVQI